MNIYYHLNIKKDLYFFFSYLLVYQINQQGMITPPKAFIWSQTEKGWEESTYHLSSIQRNSSMANDEYSEVIKRNQTKSMWPCVSQNATNFIKHSPHWYSRFTSHALP